MLKVKTNWIALNIAWLREVGLAVESNIEHHARFTKGQVQFVLWQGDVHERGVRAVQDCRNLATTADPARSALAKFRAGGSGDVDVSHEVSLYLIGTFR